MRQLALQSWPASLLSKQLMQSRQIASICPGSPAEALGIQPDWQILQVDGDAPTVERLNRARIEGLRSLHLYDPRSAEVWALEAGAYPLGLKTMPALNDDFLQNVAARRVHFIDLHRIWNQGNWKDFAKLTKQLEIAVLPFGTALLGPLVGAAARERKILASKDITHLHLLALAYFAEGRQDLSARVQSAVEAQVEAQKIESLPSEYFALNTFLAALRAFAAGDAAQAMRLAENGSLEFPDQLGLTRLFSALSAQAGVTVVSRHLGRPFPLPYRLPQHDPFGQWPEGTEVALTETLAAMRPDQMLLVYALGPYRTNGPFQAEMASLVALHAHAPQRIAAVHLITSHEDRDSSWQARNQIEDQARAAGLPVTVLSDPGGTVEQALRLTKSPSLYVLDHRGNLLATEPLADEDGYWLALERLSQGATPPPLAETPGRS